MCLKGPFDPTPLEIFLTIKEEFKPLFFTAITIPSKGCDLSLVPSLTRYSTKLYLLGKKQVNQI